MSAMDENKDISHENIFKSPKIIIIGAGISGIVCARYLQNHGFHNYEIIEGTERIGGRILSLELETAPDQCAELGANWIHGIELNPIFKLCKENGLIFDKPTTKKLGHKTLFVKETGQPISAKIVENVDWIFGQLIENCHDFFQLSLDLPEEENSVGYFVETAFERRLTKFLKEDAHTRRMVLNQRLLGEAIISGASTMHDVSLTQVGSFADLPGVHHTVPGGFEKVFNILMRDIDPKKIRHSNVVDEIEYSENGVIIHCQNGNKFYSDNVVCTIPLGCIKNNHERLFNPTLPQEKISAIENIGFGVVNKIILEFQERVLPPGVSRVELMWDHKNPQTQLIPEMWARKIPYFDEISDNVLMCWLCGKEAEILEELDEEEIGTTCQNILKIFLKRSYMPKLIRVVCSKWKKNELTQGSYCHIPPCSTIHDIEQLSTPLEINEIPRVCFAGEATHPMYYSSSHGAYLTGEREAERIIDFYKTKFNDI